MPATFVVTGAAGFIGSHLSEALLAEGHRVIGIDDLDDFYPSARKRANVAPLPRRSFELIEMDVRDERLREVLRRAAPDAVFHLAALAGVRPSLLEPARYLSVNVDGTRSLLDAARAAGCRRVLFASSSSVYGDGRVPFAEEGPADRPLSPYAASKRSAELLCRAWASCYDMRIAIARLFTVYGPRQRPDLAISRFMGLISTGEPVPMYGDGTSSRDYTFVDDIVAGLRSALGWCCRADDPTARVFNLGSSSPVALGELVEMVARTVGRPARIRHLPAQPGDAQRTWADLRRSSTELGYAPAVPLEEGLKRQWEAMKGREMIRA